MTLKFSLISIKWFKSYSIFPVRMTDTQTHRLPHTGDEEFFPHEILTLRRFVNRRLGNCQFVNCLKSVNLSTVILSTMSFHQPKCKIRHFVNSN